MRRLVLLCALMLLCGLIPAAAEAADVTFRIEATSGTIFPRGGLTLPTTAVAPAGVPDGQTCPGDSVIGAVHAAVSGDWSGDWSVTTGWSLTQIKTTTADPANAPRQAKWVVILNGNITNVPPCQKILAPGDSVLVYPACLPATTNFGSCYQNGPLDLMGPNNAVGSPGAPVKFTVFQTTVSLDNDGNGSSQRATSAGAVVSSPEGSSKTDERYGTGETALWIATRGSSDIAVFKNTFVPDRTSVCITDGADGFCGTTRAPPNPFDPYAFCQTTGNDGYCNSPDQIAPLGRISTPRAAASFPRGEAPQKLTGTVDFDPTLTDHVDLRLMRQITAKVIVRYKKTKVIVKKKVHGKVVRKRVTKKIPVRALRTVCYGWSDTAATWKKLKKCDASTATKFRAEGAEEWTYAFLNKLPYGKYTLDALAQDGAGNVDTARENGRNRILFSVK